VRAALTQEQAASWFRELSNWGRWGPDDELGTLNLITPDKRAAAARLVRDGIVVSCARSISYENVAAGPPQVRHFMLKSGDGQPVEITGRAGTADAFLIQPHGHIDTHLDAPAHTLWRSSVNEPWTMYNGKPKDLVSTIHGATVGSIELAGGGIVSRGVLLDIAQVRGVDWLEAAYRVTPSDLEAAERAQGVQVETGDILFMRTGLPRHLAHLPPTGESSAKPGLDPSCLPWLRQRDVAVISTDGVTDPTVYPGIGHPIHGIGMASLGLWLMDNPTFEDLCAVCQRLGRWEFQAVIAPLKLLYGTGSPVNPLALL
jgi:kynurenine formamidase